MSHSNIFPHDYDSSSFVDLYMHAIGTSEIPLIYHQWCSLFTISACVADRVWYRKFELSRLTPNLYLMLLGPSGNGKGGALSFSERLIRDTPTIKVWNGMITAPRLIDKLGKPTKDERGRKVLANSKIVLLTPELATSVGEGLMARKFVTLMTALFEGHANWDEGNRTAGDIEIKDCSIVWGAGTTSQWCVECLPKSAIDSGFLARSVIANAEYDYNKRIPKPSVPDDFFEVYQQLQIRCLTFAAISGEMSMTPPASRIHDEWYMTRPQEHEVALEAAWHRDDDLCLKLSMLLSLAESPLDMTIETRHLVAAQRLIVKAHKGLPALLAQASQTPESEVINIIRNDIKKAGTITHRSLMQRMGARGKRARDVRDATLQLRGMGEININNSGPRGGVIYEWKG